MQGRAWWKQQGWYRDEWGTLAVTVYNEMFRTRAPTIAAAVAFYFLLALVPLLVILSSVLGFLPYPDIFGQLLILLSGLVPPEAMVLVNKIVASVLTPHRGKLLSFGILGYLWASSGGFSALIEALDIAYDVPQSRPWWRHRLQAIFLTCTTGALAALSLFAIVAGPQFGDVATQLFSIPGAFARIWPALRILLIVVTFVVSNALLFYIGPNRRQSARSTLPGATFAVIGWFAGSFGLNFYLRHFSNYNATYGSLGAVICLMLWMYVIALATLLGAELNAERLKLKRARPNLLAPATKAPPQAPPRARAM